MMKLNQYDMTMEPKSPDVTISDSSDEETTTDYEWKNFMGHSGDAYSTKMRQTLRKMGKNSEQSVTSQVQGPRTDNGLLILTEDMTERGVEKQSPKTPDQHMAELLAWEDAEKAVKKKLTGKIPSEKISVFKGQEEISEDEDDDDDDEDDMLLSLGTRRHVTFAECHKVSSTSVKTLAQKMDEHDGFVSISKPVKVKRTVDNEVSQFVETGAVGTVTRFGKGFGFIKPDNTRSTASVFIHQSNLIMEGFRCLNPGQRVVFDLRFNSEKQNFEAMNCHLVV